MDSWNARKNVREISKVAAQNTFSLQILHSLRQNPKLYKRTLSKIRREFKQSVIDQLDTLHSKIPAKYWKLFLAKRRLARYYEPPVSLCVGFSLQTYLHLSPKTAPTHRI